MVQGHCQRAHSLHIERNDATARIWYGMVPSRVSRVPELANVLTACNVGILLWAKPPQTTMRFSKRARKGQVPDSPAHCSGAFSMLSSAFKVDCISLRVSVFSLALAPTAKAATRRRLASRSFPLQLLLPCGPNANPLAASSPPDDPGSVIVLLLLRHRAEVLLLFRADHIFCDTNHCSRLRTKCCWRAPWTTMPPCTSRVAQSSRASSVEHAR